MAYTVIGRIRPRPMGAWNAETEYEALDVVMQPDGASAFMAVQNVPAGIALAQSDYWLPIVNINAAVDAAKEATDAARQAAAEVKEDVDQLKDDLNNCVALDGENQVTPQNIAGVTFDKKEIKIVGDNIFSESYLGENGYYASVNTNANPPIISHATLDGIRWYAIPVDGISRYTFTQARFACLAKGNTIGSEAIGDTLSNVDEANTTGASYLFLSYYSSVTSIEVRKVTIDYEYSNFSAPDWMTGAEKDDISRGIVSKNGEFSATGDNILLSNARSNLRKGIRLVFEATVASGTDFELGFSISEESATTYPHNVIAVDMENVTYNGTSYLHGLSIAGRLQMIFEYLADGTADITLICDGNSFKQNVSFRMSTVAVPYVKSNGLIATDCKLSFICTDIRKKIWMFGDSYFTYTASRWPYYLKEYGYDNNVLLDGFPGMGGVNGRTSFSKLLNLGTPKIAVWFLGMNDGTDDDDTVPNTNWKYNVEYFIALCRANNVEPIFATIPNVPSINHKGKNAWIKSSGYRYIDMCHAVGADVDVNWYGDMLSSDKIHPAESGAKALFGQVLLDLPEVMLDML